MLVADSSHLSSTWRWAERIRAQFFQLEIRNNNKKREILSERRESGMVLKSVSLYPKTVMLTHMSFVTTRASRRSTATPLRTKWQPTEQTTESTPQPSAVSGRPGIHEIIYCSGSRHRNQSTEERQSSRPGWHPNGADQAVWTQGTRLAISFVQLLYRD